MNEIDRLKEKLKNEREKNKNMQKLIRLMKRGILSKMKVLEEEIKDIMYMGDKK